MKYRIYLLVLGLLPGILQAQTTELSGVITNSKGNPVAFATIILKTEKGLVLKFTSSDATGTYRLTLPEAASVATLQLEFSCLGYKRLRLPLVPGQTRYNARLEEQFDPLPEVTVKPRPKIEVSGDTLRYDVGAFARPEDRSIGDVIRRLPGVEVDEDGQIYFNGKAISNLFIHGDDLMDGRYGLATRTITLDMIRSVEVLQHHQPIKVLRDKVRTDDVAINLVLKDENSLKLSGEALLAAGLPGQYEGALNTMLFNKKFKMLNALKANNSGLDYRPEFTQFGAQAFLTELGSNRPQPLLSLGTAGNPDLPRRNYYFNKSGVIHGNNLVNTPGGLQLRSNVQAFIDRSDLDYYSRVDQYFSGDTIRYREQQYSESKPYLINNSLTAMLNKERYYLYNNTRLNFSGTHNYGWLQANDSSLKQHLRERVTDISNDFNYTPAIRARGTLDFRWFLNYFNQPQQLSIDAGLHPALLNQQQAFLATDQYAATPALFNHAALSYLPIASKLRQRYQLGVLSERQNLNATLRITQLDGQVTDYTGDAGNDLHWKRNQFYFNSYFSVLRKSWEANLTLPLNWQLIRYQQQAYGLDHRQQQLLFSPQVNIKFLLNDEDYLSLKYQYSNNIGNSASGVYRGAILTNYRSLSANDAGLQEWQNSGTGITYNFQRSLRMFYMDAGLQFTSISTNSIRSQELSNQLQRTILLPYDNVLRTVSFNAGLRKYLFALKATVTFKASLSRSSLDQLTNQELLPFYNDALQLQAGIDTRLFRKLGLSYKGSGHWNKSWQKQASGTGKAPPQSMMRLDQQLSLTYSPKERLFITTLGRHIYSSRSAIVPINYVFLDANLRYKIARWHSEFDLELSNLLNIRQYEIYLLNANQFALNSYRIRGRMLIARLRFNL